MKRIYENPMLLVSMLAIEDVLTASGISEENQLKKTVGTQGIGNTSNFKMW